MNATTITNRTNTIAATIESQKLLVSGLAIG